jgi:hypothetical protein
MIQITSGLNFNAPRRTCMLRALPGVTTGWCLNLLYFIFLSGFQLFMPEYVPAYEDGDWQFWNSEIVQGNLTDTTSAKISGEWRFGDNMKELYYYHTEMGLSFKLNETFSIAPNYRQVYSLSTNKRWVEERMPNLEFFNTFSLQELKFANRFRIEYRNKMTSEDTWRFREKLTWNFPCRIKEMKPYLADEIYYEDEPGDFNRNWVILGVKFPLMEKCEADIFYNWERSKSGEEWKDSNILNMYLKVRL